MKELYLDAEMDVVKFTLNDVITTSSGFVPDEDEGPPVFNPWG